MYVYMYNIQYLTYYTLYIYTIRYLDDIFCMWTDGLEKLKEFFNYLNSCHPTIKFTMDCSDTTINFLDISVTKNSTKLSTDLFTVKIQIPTNIYMQHHATLIVAKNLSLMDKQFA